MGVVGHVVQANGADEGVVVGQEVRRGKPDRPGVGVVGEQTHPVESRMQAQRAPVGSAPVGAAVDVELELQRTPGSTALVTGIPPAESQPFLRGAQHAAFALAPAAGERGGVGQVSDGGVAVRREHAPVPVEMRSAAL
jgi:hypothetical protein